MPVGIPRPAGPAAPAAPRLEGDRVALRELGVGETWVARFAGRDRFDAVRAMLAVVPSSGGGPDPELVVVVGATGIVRLEAHRVAVDLPDGDHPRRVLAVAAGPFRERNLLAARRRIGGPMVLAIDCEPGDAEGPAAVAMVGADFVVAVVRGADPREDLRWLRTLGRLDAVAVDAQPGVPGLLTLLELGVPLARVDGVSTDPLSFAAVICAHLSDREDARGAPESGS